MHVNCGSTTSLLQTTEENCFILSVILFYAKKVFKPVLATGIKMGKKKEEKKNS